MYAIASMLSKENWSGNVSFDEFIRVNPFKRGVDVPYLPHVSWFVASKIDPDEIAPKLGVIAREQQPLRGNIQGLGLFNQQPVVVYISLKRNHLISYLHNQIWQNIGEYAEGIIMNYSPERWIPHITLGYGEIIKQKIASSFQSLCFIPLEVNLMLDNLAIIYNHDGDSGIACHFYLDGKKCLD